MMYAAYALFAAFSPQDWAGIAIPVLILVPCLAWALTSPSLRRQVERFFRRGLDIRAGRRRGAHQPKPDASPPAQPRPAAATGLAPLNPEPASLPNTEPSPGPVAAAAESGAFNRRCKMDLAATRAGLELTVELPGVEDDDIKIQLIDDLLTISGHVSFEPDREEKNYRLIERDFGSFSRSIELPEGVAHDKIKATLSRGLLTVTIPNPSKPEPRTIPVQGQPMRLAETDDGYELIIDMPGLKEADVEVLVADGQLTVREDRKPELGPTGLRVALARPGHGGPMRSVDLPARVDPDQISAVLSNGVLKVTLPSPSQSNLRKIEVRAAA